jgi:hypothetical protein
MSQQRMRLACRRHGWVQLQTTGSSCSVLTLATGMLQIANRRNNPGRTSKKVDVATRSRPRHQSTSTSCLLLMLGSWPCTEVLAAATITSNWALSSRPDAGRGPPDSCGHVGGVLLGLLEDGLLEACVLSVLVAPRWCCSAPTCRGVTVRALCAGLHEVLLALCHTRADPRWVPGR